MGLLPTGTRLPRSEAVDYAQVRESKRPLILEAARPREPAKPPLVCRVRSVRERSSVGERRGDLLRCQKSQ